MRLNWKKIEQKFETILWNFRFFVILPVVCSLVSSLKFFLIGTLDICAGVRLNFDLNDPEGKTTYKIVSYIIGGIDYYLIGIVLLIFGLGIYELFVSKIDIRFKDEDINILQSIQDSIDIIYLASAILLISISSYLLKIQYQNSDHNH